MMIYSHKNILNPDLFPVDTQNMEIISFINQDYSERKTPGFLKRPNFKRTDYKRPVKERSISSYAIAYPDEDITFRAGRIKRQLSPKGILIAIGQMVSLATGYISLNLKKILISLICVIAGVSIGVASYKLIIYKQNHIGALTFNNEDDSELDAVSRLMSTFALDTSVQIDEFGHVLGEEIDSSSIVLTQPVSYQTYTVLAGDTIGGIAKKFGLSNISTLISVNNISNVRSVYAGQKLKIPSVDGIIYKVGKGDSLNSIVEKNKLKLEVLIDVNDLTSEVLSVGQEIFLPGVSLDANTLRNAMGDLFKLPIKAKFRWTSPYGYRIDPIKKVKAFHTGTDMACPTGTPIFAAMSGTVSYTGVSSVFGNYVIVSHPNGYQTLYAHMSKILVKKGQSVGQDTKLGLVGSTGYSTGPHLHFTVYKNGKIVDPMTVLKK